MTLQASDKYPDEVAALISFIPVINNLLALIEETKDENSDSSEDDDEQMAPGEFVFLLD